jgi:O-antigen ligase
MAMTNITAEYLSSPLHRVAGLSRFSLIVAFWFYLAFIAQIWISPVDFLMLQPGQAAPDPLLLAYIRYAGLVLSLALIVANPMRLIASARLIPEIGIISIVYVACILRTSDPLAAIPLATNTFVMFCAPIIFGYYLGYEYLVRCTWKFLIFISLVSVLLGLSRSDYGIMHSLGDEWRGVFNHKNTLGAFLAVTLLLTFYANKIIKASIWVRTVVALLCVGGLVGANSMSPLAAILIAIVGSQAILLVRRVRPRLLVPPLFILILFAFSICIWNMPWFLDLIGRDVTLTGRTNSWDAVLPLIFANPFGLGPGGAAAPIVIEAISQRFGRSYSAIDNAYIVMALEFGLWFPAVYGLWLAGFVLGVHRKATTIGASLLPALALFLLAIATAERSGGPYLGLPFAVFCIVLIAYRFAPLTTGGYPHVSEKNLTRVAGGPDTEGR